MRRRVHQSRTNDNNDTSSTASTTSTSGSSDNNAHDNLSADGTLEDKIEYSNIYEHTDPSNLTCLKDGAPGHTVDPIPYTGESKEFSVKITDDEVKELMDKHGDIRYHKMLEWTLPRFGENNDMTLFKWQVVRMRNYMLHIQEQEE